jgi:hypothetical protein
MAWRLRYEVNLDYVGRGEAAMTGLLATPLPGGGTGGQTLGLTQGGSPPTPNASPISGPVVAGTGTARVGGNELASADITAMLASMTTDLSAQLNAQLARVNQWPAGGAGSIL